MSSVLIVTGETSGDLHGANLAREMLKLRPELKIFAVGGQNLADAGAEILHDATRHATVGLIEAIRHLGHYARLYRMLVSFLRRERPSAVVLIDLPDFNLKFGRHVHSLGIPIAYYVSPQVWAWRKGRVKTIAKIVKKMLVILPFEEEFYRKRGVDASYVGNPLLDAIPEKFETRLRDDLGVKGRLIGLLPASRLPQFRRLFPVMMETCRRISAEFPDTRFVVGCAPNIDSEMVKAERDKLGLPQIDVVQGRTYDVMAASDLLLVTSGTSTLEAGIFGTPMIVTYKFNPISAALGLMLVRLKNYALVNIVLGRKVVPEYYQWLAKPELLAREAVSMIRDGRLESMRRELAQVRRVLGEPGASRRAAERVLELV